MGISSFTAHVNREMRRLEGSGHDARFLRNYYRTELDLLGLTLPVQRNRHREGYPSLADMIQDERAEAWLRVWQESNLHESMSQTIFFFETWARERAKTNSISEKPTAAYDRLWPYLVKMVDRIDNWAHSDALSSLISAAVEERPERYKTLVKWNRSAKPWYRRQSIVSLHYYSRARKTPFGSAKTLPLIESLLDDKHFYVQRGVGWALRECYNVDPKATLRFLDKHIHRVAPPGYFAAVEKLAPKDRARLKEVRLARRKAAKNSTTRS